VKTESADVSGERIIGLLEHLKDSAKEDYERLTILREMISHQS
jgi:hypothetical protein